MADYDRDLPSPASSSSAAAAAAKPCRRRGLEEEDVAGDLETACAGKKCQSCTAGVIADCVAVCCCPCAVVNILTLTFVKLPWAVARRCLDRRKRRRRRRMLEERRKSGVGDVDGISGKVRAGEGNSEIVVIGEEELNDDFGVEFKMDDVWLELYEVGHLGFGRVSFTGINFQDRGN